MNIQSQILQTYAPTSAPIRTERSVEHQLFTEITARLTKAAGDETPQRARKVAEALHENRTLWHTIATSVADPENQLPDTLRARLFYLAEFSDTHSRAVLEGRGDIGVLIDINRAVMDGLSGRAPNI